MIDLIYQIILTILNKENAGYLSPTEFNVLAAQVQNQIYREYFEDLNRDQNRANRGLSNQGYADLPFNQRQRISQFAETINLVQVAGTYNLPDNLYYLEKHGLTLEDEGIIQILEEIPRNKINFANGSKQAASLSFPTYERFSSSIRVFPSAIIDDIECRYIRLPRNPNWTFQVIGGSPLFDPTNPSFQDFELQQSELSNIVIRMAGLFGVNIRDLQVTQLLEQVKNQNYVKDSQ